MEQSFGSTPSEEIPPPPPPINLSFPLIGIPFLISMRFVNLVFVIFTFSAIVILITILRGTNTKVAYYANKLYVINNYLLN